MMSQRLDLTETDHEPYRWRTGGPRVLINALLVLLAFEGVSLLAAAAQMIITSSPPPATPVDGVPLIVVVAGFLLIRWLFVLPGLLLALIGIECVARRAPHPRVLTAIVAFVPMVWWALTQSSGDTSGFAAILGATAALVALLARLPASSILEP
jgi:hypothetical protein